MDIVSRIKKFLDQTGISNSQFADTCEIPRPTLSQLLNGRNKKVSNEVIDKIHTAYPTLNIMWLMFGDGEMCLSGADTPAADENNAAPHNGESLMDDKGQRAISFVDDDASGFPPAHSTQQRSRQPSLEAIQDLMRHSGMGRMAPRGNASADGRRVESILVFYSDGRFEQFGPSK